MTTEKDTVVTPGYGQPVTNYPKRYTLGSKHYKHEVAPCMMEHPQGKYVLFDDFAAAVAHNEMLLARLKKQAKEVEANNKSVISNELLRFLRGSAPIEGIWFGDSHPSHKGNFWWRKLLPEPVDEPEVCEEKPSGPISRLFGGRL
jgi:hypothetical protein